MPPKSERLLKTQVAFSNLDQGKLQNKVQVLPQTRGEMRIIYVELASQSKGYINYQTLFLRCM